MMIVSESPRRWLGLLRWSAAALAVTVAHGSVAWVAATWRPAPAEAAAGAPEPAIMIELAAVSVAPEAPAEALPVAPERVEAEEPPPEPEPEPVAEPVVEPPLPEPEPVALPEPEITLPELPSVPDALAVLAPPPPKKLEKRVERKPPPKPRVVERKPVERKREATAPLPSQPRATAPSQAAQGTASASSASTASWRGSLMAHLNRYKRFPAGARPGTVQVAFSIDRSGRVLSARLVNSSGDSALDAEGVAMMRRASPVPAPPATLAGGGAIALAVPLRFSR